MVLSKSAATVAEVDVSISILPEYLSIAHPSATLKFKVAFLSIVTVFPNKAEP